jgi:hypothetical protein
MLTLENASYMLDREVTSWSDVPEETYFELLYIPINMTIEEYKEKQEVKKKENEEYLKNLESEELPF